MYICHTSKQIMQICNVIYIKMLNFALFMKVYPDEFLLETSLDMLFMITIFQNFPDVKTCQRMFLS